MTTTITVLRGDGIEKPMGILNGFFDATGKGSISTIGEMTTGVSGGFDNATAAAKLIAEKTKKGYAEQTASSGGSISTVTVPSP